MKSLSRQFLGVKTLDAFYELLNLNPIEIPKILGSKQYTTFKSRKKSGGFRIIENPNRALKSLQSELNDFLQCVYFFFLPKASHGFVASPDNDGSRRRNIVSNARIHLGSEYLLNLDLLDFFHKVTQKKVENIFKAKPFSMSSDLVTLLTDIVCYNGRLPMGSPASPVISNFAMIDLDEKLQAFSESKKWYYSRFVDDLSFSSHKPIVKEDIIELEKLILLFEFPLNKSKIKIFGPEDKKCVTSIVLKDTELAIDDEYLLHLRTEIEHFRQMNLMSSYFESKAPDYMDKYKSSISGRIQFVKMVLGDKHKDHKQLHQLWKRANLIKLNDYGALAWLDFDY
ncbi:MAG: reverse transcriptase family protein [Saprospiraceae bacterium]